MPTISATDPPRPNLQRTAEDDAAISQIARYEDFTTVDWIQDAQRERTRVRALHASFNSTWFSLIQRVYEASQAWWVVLLVGLLVGINAALISIAAEWLSDLKLGHCSTGWWLNEKFCCWENWNTHGSCDDWRPWSTIIGLAHDNLMVNWLVYVAMATGLALACAFLVREYAPYAAGSGIPEIKSILSGFVIKGFMGGWTLLIKSVGLTLAVSSGLSVGKEGPSVHVACCVGNVVSRMFSKFKYNRAKQREILSAASAAGVAVAFAAPIGGVLFSLEELSSYFPLKTLWRSFFCALIATAFNPFRTGKLVMFQAYYDKDWHFFEVIFFIIIGIFGALYGALVIKFNIKVAAFRKRYLKPYAMTEVSVLALSTAIICYLNIFLRNDMSEVLSYLLRSCKDGDYSGLCRVDYTPRMIWLLFMATVIRMTLTIFSYGTKVPCGIFVPSMAVGATFGRMVGLMVQSLHRARPHSVLFAACPPDSPCIEPAIYAFLGAGAFLGGVTKMTISLVVIMFELTGALNYIVPTMITVMVTKVAGDLFGSGGISDHFIKLYGLPYMDKEEHLYGVPISRVMVTEPVVLTARGLRLHTIQHLLENTQMMGFPIVDTRADMRIQGYINRSELKYAIQKARDQHGIQDDAQCFFQTAPSLTAYRIGGGTGGDGDDGMGGSSSLNPPISYSSPSSIDFGQWVNSAPFIVSPRQSAETVMEIFKKLGPRMVLVEGEGGRLEGIVTRKDILRFLHLPAHPTYPIPTVPSETELEMSAVRSRRSHHP
ncbi:chloride channel [Dimargaris cristalligena]|uniref:Chloride channel protein n=1 Tax=Dimargaris cristalligena TaxID=215637 RepID=A0A4P9ZU63_9FUNG|nr:chloride channel [Dimargaris cristalligena]|eukprot:RKP37067.1 chloride channel [Dimargaris cristalligena]